MQSTHCALKKMLVLILILSMSMVRFSISMPITAQAASTEPALDRYGGWMELDGNNHTGHWTVELIGTQYWLLTPENHVMWVVGHTFCTPGPTAQECPSLGYAPTGLVNKAKYAPVDTWTKRQVERSQGWGFNNTLITDNAVTPASITRCKLLDMNWVSVPKVSTFFPDVFDPKYEIACVNKAEEAKPFANDPGVIGVYLGNEQLWNGEQYAPIGLPNTFIALSPAAAGKQYWVNTFLKTRYVTVDRLNSAYGTQFHSWEDLLQCTSLPDNASYPSIRADKCDFSEEIAEAYYKPLAAAVRAVAPKLLILSERLLPMEVQQLPYLDYCERIWKEAGKYCDVFCINSYLDYVKLEQTDHVISLMVAASGKPILITEHSYVANDTNLAENYGGVNSQTDRAFSYVDYINRLIGLRVKGPTGQLVNPFLGIVWYKWNDDPVLAGPGGEHYNFGLLDGQDEAYTPLTDVMAVANKQIYGAITCNRDVMVMTSPELIAPANDLTVADCATFSWTPVGGAASYTLLVSPEKAFPDEQTIRYDNITGTSFTLPEPIANGHFWWCVRANESATGSGGYYSEARGFRVHNSVGVSAAALGLEQFNQITFEDAMDAGGAASSYAFRDTTLKNEGLSSARCVFTKWALNKAGATGRDDASIFINGLGASQKWTGVRLSICPTNFCDATGVLVPSSKSLRLRVWDQTGTLFLEWPLDPEGTLSVGQWSTLSVPFGTYGPQSISKIALTLVTGQDKLACDQRVIINLDDVVPITDAADETPPPSPVITNLALSAGTLSVRLDATDLESGIADTEICLGTTSGASDLAPWTQVENAKSVQLHVNSDGTSPWYLSAKSQNGAGSWSAVTTVEGSKWAASTRVTSLSEEHGAIVPAGTVLVDSGTVQVFHASPEFGYAVRDIIVDGESAGPSPEVTITGDGRTHSVVARFAFSEGAWKPESLPAEATTVLSMPIGSKTYLKDGTTMALDVPSFISSGRTLVPVRAISEGLGADVQWDAVERTVTINFRGLNDDHVVTMAIGDFAYRIDGVYAGMDVVPVIVNGRTFVPLRVAGEALGARVDWNADTRTVVVKGVNVESTPLHDGRTLRELYTAAAGSDANSSGIDDTTETFFASSAAATPACERTLVNADVLTRSDDTSPCGMLPGLSIVVPIGVHGNYVKVRYGGQLTGYVLANTLEQRTRDLPSVTDPEKWVPAGGRSLQTFLNDAAKTQDMGYLRAGQSVSVVGGVVTGISTGDDPFGFETAAMIAAPSGPFGIQFRVTTADLAPSPIDRNAVPLFQPSVYFIGRRNDGRGEWWDGFLTTEITMHGFLARDGVSDQNHTVSETRLRSGQLYQIRFPDETGKTAVITLPDGTLVDTLDMSGLTWTGNAGCFPDHRLAVGIWIQGHSSITVSDLAFIVPPTAQ